MRTMKMCRSLLSQFSKKWDLYKWGETLSKEVLVLRECYKAIDEADPDFGKK